MDYREYLDKLKAQKLPPVIAVFSGEEYLSKKAVEDLKDKLGGEVPEFNVTIFGEKASQEVFLACEQLPFMSNKRLVIVQNPVELFKAQDSGRLIQYIDSPVSDTILVLWLNAKPDMRTLAAKALSKAEGIIEIDPPDMPMLIRWVRKLGEDRVSAIDAEFLIYRTGKNMINLQNEVEKLLSLAGYGPITREHINALITPGIDENVFKIVDMLLEKHNDDLLMHLDNLIVNGEKPAGLISVLLGTFHNLYVMKLDTRDGVKLNIPDFVAKKYRKALRTISLGQVESCIGILLEGEDKLKSGRMQPEIALYEGIARVSMELGKKWAIQ